MPVSEVLKQKRKKARLTQAELAEISGVSQQAISFIENGRNTPSEGTMRLLAKALGCTVAELMGESPQEIAPDPLREDIIRDYDQLPPEARRLVRAYIDLLKK